MTLRKLPACDGGYLIGSHPEYGFILIDPARHLAREGRERRAYSLQDLGEVSIPGAELWSGVSGDVSDSDADLVLYYYESFRRSKGRK